MDRWSRAIVVAVIATALAGCAHRVVTVGALDVSPAVTLPAQGRHLSLDLAPVTPDAIRFATRGFPVVEVSAFRTTLRRAFERAFAPSLAGQTPGPADATLLLEVTELAFVSSKVAPPMRDEARRAAAAAGAEIVLVHGSSGHPPQVHMPRFRYARIRFTASLRLRGAEASRLSGFATAQQATDGDAHSIEQSLASAVSVLYQQIARELFERSLARADSP
jgi:hypothetical protein